MVRERTGLVLDPYFSATKMRWLLDEGGLSPASSHGGLAFGTVDSWVLWNLTGGSEGGSSPPMPPTPPAPCSRHRGPSMVA